MMTQNASTDRMPRPLTTPFSDPALFRKFAGVHKAGECVQCGRCSSSCAVAFKTPDTPRKVIRYLQWEDVARAAGSPFLYLCKQCIHCTVNCPRGIDVAGIMRDLVIGKFLFY
jgi:heterodisulfide reductase subunit C